MRTKLLASRAVLTIFVTLTPFNWSAGQTLKARPPQPSEAAQPPAEPLSPAQTVESISLTVPVGTPLKVSLDQEIRIRKIGQPVHGKLTEPVYAFDKLVAPSGSEVIGKIAEIDDVPKTRRTLAALNADFSPPRQVRIEFDELVLTDGRHLPLQTIVSPGSQGVLQFVPANAKAIPSTTERAKNAASKEVSEIHQEIKKQIAAACQQVHEPGKMHRLERLVVAQLPYHPQYMDSGTGFNADLQQPLNFGSEPLKPESLTSIGNPPPSGSVVHALLLTPLNSASARKGDPVDAIISQPLVVSDQLFLPEGSHIRGSVLQVRAARRLNRNGQLRIVFHEVVPPNGLEEKIEASLEGVEVARGEHLSLDAEGGARVITPRTRYLTTAIAVALASSSAAPDHDQGLHGGSGGDAGGGAANGFSGLGLVGTLAGTLARSRIVTSGFGFYGAAISVYSHFLARGRDVVYPKDMSMVIGLGIRSEGTTQTAKISSH